jgi:hypothetical protein
MLHFVLPAYERRPCNKGGLSDDFKKTGPWCQNAILASLTRGYLLISAASFLPSARRFFIISDR